MIGLVPGNSQKIIPYATCDTVALLGALSQTPNCTATAFDAAYCGWQNSFSQAKKPIKIA